MLHVTFKKVNPFYKIFLHSRNTYQIKIYLYKVDRWQVGFLKTWIQLEVQEEKRHKKAGIALFRAVSMFSLHYIEAF